MVLVALTGKRSLPYRFALSCVEQFAQKHAMDTANARIEAQLGKKKES